MPFSSSSDAGFRCALRCVLGLTLVFDAAVALPVTPASFCARALETARQPFTWLFHAGSDRGRTFRYPDGVTVEERVTWFGIRRRIVVTEPDGSFVDFNRTDRSRRELWKTLYFPAAFFDSKDLRGKKVLDFGCGDARLVEDLRTDGIDVHGLDIFLTASQRRRPYLTMADGAHTPFPDEAFDVLFSTQSAVSYLLRLAAHDESTSVDVYLERAAKVLREMARITKQGGVVRLSPIPELREEDGVVYPELEAVLEDYSIPLRIRRRPDADWLAATYSLQSLDPSILGPRLPSHVWVELERIAAK